MFLFNTNKSPIIYVIQAFSLAVVIASCVGWSISLITVLPDEGPIIELSVVDIIGSIIIGPLIESVLMLPFMWLLSTFIERTIIIALLNATLWSFIHSLSYPLWGVFTFSSFVIFTISYQVWRDISTKLAFSIMFGIHALLNLFVILVMSM